MRVILGIDPGSQNTGYGIVHAQCDRILHVEHGVIRAPASRSFHDRLLIIGEGIAEVMRRVKPEVTVIERIFLGKNADSAFKLGHARGVCLLAATQMKSQIVEYATRSVKKGITGSGAASKEQVQVILFAALGIRGPAQADASDALALAFYHARNLEVEMSVRRATKGATNGALGERRRNKENDL